MNTDEFRRLGHQLVDWVAEFRERIEDRPVICSARPGEIRCRFPASPPADGGHLPEALAALERDVLHGITHRNHPAFFAYFPSNTTYASVLADIVASGLGVQGMSWQTSPAATEIEEVVMDWLRQMVGLSPAWSGVIHDTASTATLCALLCAQRSVGVQPAGRWPAGGVAPLVVYASEEGHSSMRKRRCWRGFGRANLRLVATDAEHALDLEQLRRAIEADRAAGLRPAAIVAAIGTTGTTAIDPLAGMAALAGRHGAWLRVDAAMAGTAMVLPECRWMWEGVERADSVVFNPHKWMGVGYDFSAYYVRDPEHLVRVMSTNPVAFRTAQDGPVKNSRDWHIQLGRRFRALKLWFFLLDTGVDGLRARLRRDLENARWLIRAGRERAEGWERVAPVPLQTVCFRHVPRFARR